MNSIFVLLLAALGIGIGYAIYARRIDQNIVEPNPDKATPARMYMDGVDFTPASRNVLFGYQFKSVAALAPLTGPVIAVQWGWLPALAWIILGVFFIGWVQDYGAMIMGVRRDGETMGALSYKLVSPRARTILMVFIYFYLLLIMGAFGNAVGKSLLVNPKVPFGMIALVLMGVLAGQMTYKWKRDIILTSVVTVALTFVGIWLGTTDAISNLFTSLYGLPESPQWFLGNTQAQVLGTILMVIFCYLGAVLPIWSFAQPVNYVSFWIVTLGMIGSIIGLLIWRPGMGDFPAFTQFTTASGPLWPMLFVTIACGAISGCAASRRWGHVYGGRLRGDRLPDRYSCLWQLARVPGCWRPRRSPGCICQRIRGVLKQNRHPSRLWYSLRLRLPGDHGNNDHATGGTLHACGQRRVDRRPGAGDEERPRRHYCGAAADPAVRLDHPLAGDLGSLRRLEPVNGWPGTAADRAVVEVGG
jgi:hypothetical protein